MHIRNVVISSERELRGDWSEGPESGANVMIILM